MGFFDLKFEISGKALFSRHRHILALTWRDALPKSPSLPPARRPQTSEICSHIRDQAPGIL